MGAYKCGRDSLTHFMWARSFVASSIAKVLLVLVEPHLSVEGDDCSWTTGGSRDSTRGKENPAFEMERDINCPLNLLLVGV